LDKSGQMVYTYVVISKKRRRENFGENGIGKETH